MKKLVSCIIVLGIVSCTFYDRRLNIVNKTLDTLSFSVTTKPFDTFVNHKQYYLKLKLAPDSIKNVIIPGGSKLEWNKLLRASKDKRLYLYFFNYDTLERYSLEKIMRNHKFEQLSYSKEQLDDMNWSIPIYDKSSR